MGSHGLMLGLGRRRPAAGDSDGGGGPSYEAEASTYFAAMSAQPDATRKGHLNTLIAGLKADGIWTKLDWLAICAAHDEQAGRVNAVNPAQVATAPVAPTFTADRGFTGNGTTQYLASGFDPASGTPKFIQNDAHMGVWIGTNVQSSAQRDLGNFRAGVVSRTASGLLVTANAALNATKALGAATSIGHSAWTRTGSATSEIYKDGASLGTDAAVSSSPSVGSFLICAASNSGTPANFSTRRIQAVHWGSQLSDAEVTAIYTRLATYMTAVGA